ncbi:MAG: helix-turn-helix domain-containing protein [Paludibacteraceae bacterium]|nr:helix-turn-helix domain-containing protein [Paludibacteraceae bacterium]
MIAIKEHLLNKGTITSMEAIELYGCTRLSAKIFDLRNAGWDIDSVPQTGTTRFGDTCHYVQYRFVSKPEEKEGK